MSRVKGRPRGNYDRADKDGHSVRVSLQASMEGERLSFFLEKIFRFEDPASLSTYPCELNQALVSVDYSITLFCLTAEVQNADIKYKIK